MPFRFLPDVALADIAFEAESSTVSGLFETCALAVTDVMVDPDTLRPRVKKEFDLEAQDTDRLLYDFMTELIVAKDVDSLLFGRFKASVARSGKAVRVLATGEAIDRGRHRLRNDVKAVTMHLFGIRHQGGKWRTTVVLDI